MLELLKAPSMAQAQEGRAAKVYAYVLEACGS